MILFVGDLDVNACENLAKSFPTAVIVREVVQQSPTIRFDTGTFDWNNVVWYGAETGRTKSGRVSPNESSQQVVSRRDQDYIFYEIDSYSVLGLPRKEDPDKLENDIDALNAQLLLGRNLKIPKYKNYDPPVRYNRKSMFSKSGYLPKRIRSRRKCKC